tara:strand:+ start:8940 stop:9092 length:153 start_codon:yes stop_codon:yes gene_type:complete
MAKKNIELNVSIFKLNGNEFTETEADELIKEFEAFLRVQGLDYGGSHELV